MTREEATNILIESSKKHNGPWVKHSINAARTSETFAKHLDLDPDKAYIYGLLHDIGRRNGSTTVRHIIDGYNYMKSLDYEDIARYCLTHSFIVKDLSSTLGDWDMTESEIEFVKTSLNNIEYTLYDKIVQLSDYMALPNGITLVDRRILHVYLRYDFSCEQAKNNWKALFTLQEEIESKLGYSIYKLFPEVLEGISENLIKDVLIF